MKNYLALAIVAAVLSSTSVLADQHGHQDGMHNMHNMHKKFTECAAIRMKELNVKHVLENNSENFIQVPEGWTVVGGTGGEGHPKLLVCR